MKIFSSDCSYHESMVDRFDAVVIGGGPAGALAAIRLARAGWRTALVEKRKCNSDKTCGHCLHRRGVDVLRRNGLETVAIKAKAGDIGAWRLHVSRRRCIAAMLENDSRGSAGVVVRRDVFDQLLIDEAQRVGVEVFQPASAIVDEGKNGSGGACRVTVRLSNSVFKIEARLIVGADGLRSRVADLIEENSYETGGKFGFSFDVPRKENGTAHGRSELNMYVIPGGYIGVVGEGDRLHVGGLIHPDMKSGPHDPIECARRCAEMYRELREDGFDSLSRDNVTNLSGAGPMAWRPRKLSAEGIVLVGDAAGFTEPFTGEGMCWALESADVFGAVIERATVGEWTDAHAAMYQIEHGRRVRSKQRISRLAAAVVASRRFTARAADVAQVAPFLIKLIVRRVMCA